MRLAHRTLSFAVSAALISMLALVTFWPGLSGGFIFDDFPNLVREPSWKVTELNIEQIERAVQGGITGNAGRPLAILSFALNHYFTGLDPFWLKLTSLLLHACNGMLVYLLSRQLLHLIPAGPKPKGQFLAPLLLALAWMLHPLQVSTVLYVVQRMEIGAALGVLLALLAYVHGRIRQIEGKHAWPWLLAACVATIFGLGFKESALLVACFAFLIETCLLRFAGSGTNRFSRGWGIFYALGFLLALAAYLSILLPLSDLRASYGSRDFGPYERLLTQMPALVMYLKQIMLPLPESMHFYYDNFPISRSLAAPWTLASAGILMALLGAAAASWRRWPLTAFGIGWFFVAHALTSNVIPLELAFEHRNYLALLGILLALVQPLCALGSRLHGDARVTLAIVPVLALAVLCWVQASSWGNSMRLAWTLENRNPDSPRASYALGEQWLAASGGDPSDMQWSLAKQQFRRAADLPGNPSLSLQGLIVMQARHGLPLEPALWQEFRAGLTASRLTPERTGALHSVSQCRISGQCSLNDGELLATFLAVLERNPGNATAHTLYANFAWNVLKDQSLAVRLQREAVRLAPDSRQSRENLAKFLLAFEDVEPSTRGQVLEETGGAGDQTPGEGRKD